MAACPSCGVESRDGARFCDACGTALAPAPAHGGEERKVVSVLFCDLVGFTAASERADPEDVRARLRPYHDALRERIEAFGGTVEKFVGDAVMAVFGAPVAHEDDAERAVRAGLAILERIQDLNETDPGLSLSVRIGVSTGEALVALDAHPEQGEGFVTGDVVNTASRLQGAAPVDGIAVSEGTFRATEPVFEWRELAAVALKGKTGAVPLWQPIQARARFGSDVIRRLTTPLVGRDLDLLQLRTAFEKCVREPSVHLVTVTGEPGVGKSRLVAELAAHIDTQPELVRWRQGRCLPYGDGIAFWALGEIVKAEAGIYESDGPDDADAKLAKRLRDHEEAAWLRARLRPLVGIESGAPAERDESFAAWRRFLESIAEDEPTVLVFEDLHWADAALLDFLEHLADWAQGVPLCVVCTARPELQERRPAWGAGLRNATTIGLAPLSETETSTLVSLLLERTVLPAETQQAILERAGGNPLYAEEFVRMLRDRDALDEHGGLRTGSDVPFPDSLQALIAARLDTLPTESKAMLQDAAVLGKVFWAGAVASIGGRDPAAVDATLHELVRKELVRPSRVTSMEGEQEVGFWHALVRDVAYAQIPRAQRAAKHLAAADWLEAKAAERIEDMADVLAYHTDEALRLADATGAPDAAAVAPRARRYALLAGERALGLDTVRAVSLLERAVELTPEDDLERPEVVARLARAIFQSGRVAEARELQEEVVTVLRARGDAVETGVALISLSLYARDGRKPALEAIGLLETEPPGPALVLAHEQLAGVLLVHGEYTGAIESSLRALELAGELGLEVPARALGFHGSALANTGTREGLLELEQAIELLLAAGRGRDAVVATHNLAIVRWALEGPAAGLLVQERAIALAAARGLTEIQLATRGATLRLLTEAGDLRQVIARAAELISEVPSDDTYLTIEPRAARALALYELGDVARASVEAQHALAAARELDAPIALVIASSPAAACAIAQGVPRTARALLEPLTEWDDRRSSEEYLSRMPGLVRSALAAGDLELATRLANGASEALPLYAQASIASRAQLTEAQGDPRQATTQFADAAMRLHGFGARLEQAYALLGQGRCLVALGEPAESPLRRARALFEAMGARPRVAECDSLLTAALAAGA
jgi:class 3 adenylate cyclase/tetratricopeptide (TPR) repeat protein